MTEHDPTPGEPGGDPAASTPRDPAPSHPAPVEPPASGSAPVQPPAAEPPADESLSVEPSTDESLSVEPSTDESLPVEPSTDESLSVEPSTDESLSVEPSTDGSRPAEPVADSDAAGPAAGEEPTVAAVGDGAGMPADDAPTVGSPAGRPGDIPPLDEPTVSAPPTDAGGVPAGDGPAAGASAGGPGAVPPGAVPPGAVPPGAVPPGAVPPGGGSSGGSTAAGFPAGGVPPSGGPWSAFSGRRLARSSQRKVIAGVAGGLGEYTGIDPVLFRVLFAVLTLFGGSGILLYVVGWLFMPTEDEQASPIESLLHRGPGGSNRARDAAAAGALIVAGLVLAGVLALGDARDLALVLVVVGGAFFLVRNLQDRRDGGPQPPAVPEPPPPPPAPYETPLPTYQPPPIFQTPPTFQAPPTVQPQQGFQPQQEYQPQQGFQPQQEYQAQQGYQPSSYPPVEHGAPTVTLPPPPPPAPPREHSALGMITISLLLVVLGIAAALTATGAINPEPGDLLAMAVGTIGAGLLVGAWFGRARWLTWLGIPLLIALIVVSASNVSLKGGAGDRRYAPRTVAEVEPSYRIGVGNIQVDLSKVDFSEHLVHTKVSAGVGNVQVIIPHDADVSIDGRAGIGEVNLLGQVANGTSATRSVVDHSPAGDQNIDLTLDLDVSIGQVEVDRAAA